MILHLNLKKATPTQLYQLYQLVSRPNTATTIREDEVTVELDDCSWPQAARRVIRPHSHLHLVGKGGLPSQPAEEIASSVIDDVTLH